MQYVVIINEKGQCWDIITKTWSIFPKTMSDETDIWQPEIYIANESAKKDNMLIDFFFWEEGIDLPQKIQDTLVENCWNN